MGTQLLKSTLIVLALSAFLTSLYVERPVVGRSHQGKDRGVQIKVIDSQPVEITEVKIKGNHVAAGRKFAGDSDWFTGMIVTIKNISGAPVTYATLSVASLYEINGAVKRTKDERNYLAVTTLIYGMRPHLPDEPPRTVNPIPLMPGSSTDLVLSEIQRDELYSILRTEGASTDLPQLTLWIDHVAWYGDEHRMWSNGRMLRQDPKDPRHWEPIATPSSSPSPRRLNHAISKLRTSVLQARLDLSFRASLLDPLPPCIHRDGGEDIKHRPIQLKGAHG